MKKKGSKSEKNERIISVVLSEESYLKLRLLAFQNKEEEERIVYKLVQDAIEKKVERLKPEMTKMFEEFKKIL